MCYCAISLVSELQPVGTAFYHNRFRAVHFLSQEFLRQVIEQVTLDSTFYRTRAELRVESCRGKELDGFIGHLKRYAVIRQHLLDAVDLQAHNLLDLVFIQRLEHDDFIDTVQELRTDGLLQHLHHFLLGFLYDLVMVPLVNLFKLALYVRASQVGGHDDDGVLEVHRTSLVIGQPSVVQYLKQDVEHVGVCLLDFIEEHHRIRFPPHGFGQLSAFIIAYVARRRSNQTGDGMLFLILAHVDTRHQGFIIKQVFRQSFRQLGLTYTRRTEEDERTDRAFRVLQSRTAPAHGIRYGFDGFVLSDHPLVQFVFQVKQLVALALQHLAYGYARPARYHVGDVFGGHFFLNHRIIALLSLQVFLDALDFVFQRLQFPVSDFGYLAIVALAFGSVGFELQLLDFLLVLLNLVHQFLLTLPFSLVRSLLFLQFCNLLVQLSKEIAELKEQESSYKAKWEAERGLVNKIQQNKQQIERLKWEAERAEREGDYGKVAEIRYGKLQALENEIKSIQEDLKKKQGDSALIKEEVTAEDIADVVSRWTGIPVSKMLQSEREKLLHLEDELHKRVIGQDEAIEAVADAVRRSRAGLQDPKRPIGSFIFLGTTGVGKTELAKALAEYLFDDESLMTRIDMSEYQEKHTVSRLIGAPPGYVGYDEGGQLTEAVRRKPYSVVLFDEIEKAHPDVFNILLQVLDDGRLTDNKGRTVNFKNTIIIMTSNLGSAYIQSQFEKINDQNHDQIVEETKKEVMNMLKKTIRPEFLNRIDETIMFQPLNKPQIEQIVRLQINGIRKMLEGNGVTLQMTDAAVDFLATAGYDPEFGARPVKRAIQRYLLNDLSKKLLSQEVNREKPIIVEREGDALKFRN